MPPKRPASPGPSDFVDRPVHVIEQDLGYPGPPTREFAAEVCEPAVVGPYADPSQFELMVGGGVGSAEQGVAHIEGRDGIGKDDLADDAVTLQILLPNDAIEFRR